MLGVIELLKLRGLDNTSSTPVKFVRHQDRRFDLYDLMISGYLGRYQSVQSRPVFRDCDYIISFIGLPRSQARFLGVYQKLGERRVKDVAPPDGYPIPEDPEWFFYDLEQVPGFEDLQERVIIHWGKAAIKWHQWVDEDNVKEVVEILPAGYTRPWPGYLDFILTHDELVRICNNPEANREWVHKLSAVAGVYLITHEGKQYVGSAYGKEGIYGRWKQYANSGHGGNVQLEKLVALRSDAYKQFHYSILRELPKSMSKKEVIGIEMLYQQKLGSRAFGLNAEEETRR
jgi:hypothetical protein